MPTFSNTILNHVSGNRWYDQALSEMILENLDFDVAPGEKWWCVEGGSQEIAHRMKKKLRKPQAIEFGKSVTAISYVAENSELLDVTIKGEEKPRRYDAVFNSVPLGAMQHMQLEGLKLNWETKSAIRSLGYGASCKVGVRFKSLWWKNKETIHLPIDNGGVAKTDLPIRCCVYPSYNIHDPVSTPGVLLVSYTWSQEAERIGALINRDSPEDEEKLKEVLIHDLARLHAKTRDEDKDDEDYKRLHKIISDEYLSHYAHNWYSDKNSVGAFAYFGPGQFQHMYPFITGSNGQHIIIGEAASTHHAWVVGALESAVRGVYQFLYFHSKYDKAASDAAKAYAANEISGPYGPLPAEFDRPVEVETVGNPAPDVKETDKSHVAEASQVGKDHAAEVASAIGELARWQVIFENIRLQQGGDKIVAADITEKDVSAVLQPIAA
jgi:monoamine oxidase